MITFYQDIKSLFGEGALVVITNNSDNSEIIIKSIVQADADVIHVVNDQAILNHGVWKDHSLKLERVCKRLQFGAKVLTKVLPLVSGLTSIIYSFNLYESGNTTSVFLIAALLSVTLILLILWPRFLSRYIAKLPQKVFA